MSALKPDLFIPALNTDVLTIIFEELLNSADIPCDQPNCWDSFLSLRLLSKQLNDIVVRVGFRQISFGSGILECFKTYLQVYCQKTLEQPWFPHTPESVQAQLEVAEYTRTYTRHIWFDYECSNLDWSWVPDMLNSLQNLTHITYVLGLSLSLQQARLTHFLAVGRIGPSAKVSASQFNTKCLRVRGSVQDGQSCVSLLKVFTMKKQCDFIHCS